MLKGVVVVIADPLITIPRDPLDASYLVPGWIEIILGDNILDFLEAEDVLSMTLRESMFRKTHSNMPAAFEHGPGLAPPLNWQTPFGRLQEESLSVKLRPYYSV